MSFLIQLSLIKITLVDKKLHCVFLPALYGRNYEFALEVQLLHQLSTFRHPTAEVPPHHCMLYFVQYQMYLRVRLSYPYLWKTFWLYGRKHHIDGGPENPTPEAQVAPLETI